MGLVDPALLSALMLSLAFAVVDGRINRECLSYRDQAISHIRERMGSPGEATSESTLGAILLLAGVEVRRLFFLVFPWYVECRPADISVSRLVSG